MYKDSTSLVIVTYPSWSGGKFLINCLGLSDQCYFQSAQLAERQRSNKFNPIDKLNLLLYRISLVTNEWDDLKLGCTSLFGINKWYPHDYHTLLKKLAVEDKLFFVVAHNEKHFKELIKIWTRATIIFFKGSHNFIRWRLGDELFARPTDFGLYKTEPDYPHHYKKLINIDTNVIYWDADWYLDKDLFLTHLQDLYKQFNLTDYNQDLIEQYYDNYMSKLNQMKDKK